MSYISALFLTTALLLATANSLEIRSRSHRILNDPPGPISVMDVTNDVDVSNSNATNSTDLGTNFNSNSSAAEATDVADGDGDGSSPLSERLKKGGPVAKLAALNAPLPEPKMLVFKQKIFLIERSQ